MLQRFFFLFSCVLVAAAGCAQHRPDARRDWWGLSDCKIIERSAAFCESRNRPWGQL